MIFFFLFVAFLFFLFFSVLGWGAVLYNRLVRGRQEAENAFSQIDVQLKRRHDLIPNLVETVKGVMKFEQTTLSQVVQARSQAVAAPNLDERLKAEGQLSGSLGRLLAVWEKYPDLKSNQNASQLQEELTTTENKIATSRGFYNDVTTNYNIRLQEFPANLVAGAFGFRTRPLYQVPEAEKDAPEVKF